MLNLSQKQENYLIYAIICIILMSNWDGTVIFHSSEKIYF